VGTQAAIPPAPGTSISPSGWQPVGTDGRPASPLGGFPQRLRQAAEQGDLAAAFEVGTRHLEGRGVPANPGEAARWYQRAAEGGIAPAQYRLGSLLEKGTGVPRDVARARSLYERAAEAGNGKAMHNLAVLFAQGAVGDRPDYRAASLWFRRAAEIGVADSQYNLGILYARGLGVDQNLAESYKWFALAALGGDQDAGSKRDEVAGRIDAQTLVAARLAVQTFTPRAEPDAAVRVAAPAGGWGDEVRPAPSQASQQRRTPGATQR
jgi:localization factor PodJL